MLSSNGAEVASPVYSHATGSHSLRIGVSGSVGEDGIEEDKDIV